MGFAVEASDPNSTITSVLIATGSGAVSGGVTGAFDPTPGLLALVVIGSGAADALAQINRKPGHNGVNLTEVGVSAVGAGLAAAAGGLVTVAAKGASKATQIAAEAAGTVHGTGVGLALGFGGSAISDKVPLTPFSYQPATPNAQPAPG